MRCSSASMQRAGRKFQTCKCRCGGAVKEMKRWRRFGIISRSCKP